MRGRFDDPPTFTELEFSPEWDVRFEDDDWIPMRPPTLWEKAIELLSREHLQLHEHDET